MQHMDNLSDLILPIAIGIISFGIGTSLKFADFKQIFIKPKAMLSGLAGQMLVLPAIAFLIIAFWPIDPVYKVGFILIAACPGGSMSNFISFVLKGRVALSVSLTAFNSIFIIFTIPLLVNLAASVFTNTAQGIELSVGRTFGEIFFSVVLPVLGGIIFNELTPKRITEKMQKPIKITAIVMLLLMVATVLFFGHNNTAEKILNNMHLMIPLVILNVSVMLAGFYLSGLVGLNHKSKYTIAIEMGLQNSALAIFIGTKVMGDPEYSVMPILYGSFTLFTSWGIGYLLKRFGDRD